VAAPCRLFQSVCLLSLTIALSPTPAHAYSQFTHEELIDLVWSDSIRPLLLERYPGTTEPALRRAHAYAYGGSLIQDVGYYPFGKRFFSDLAHYVRTGDFVLAMFRESHNIDELAFAIGALSHYLGDSIGHSEAVNPSTAIEFPKLVARYGPIVTYEEAPIDHVRTEFGFDVAQSAWQRYAPGAYRRRSGFRVARPLLYRAFRDTYGISARGILGPLRTALSSYRWSVTRLLPAFLRAEEVRLRGHLPAEPENAAAAEFSRNVAHNEYAARYKPPYSRPGFGAHVFAAAISVVPKIGELKILDVEAPVASTEALFLNSVDHAVDRFRGDLHELRLQPDPLELENLDLDTGSKVVPGQAKLVDQTYERLLFRIVRERAAVSPELRDILTAFYSDPAPGPSAGRAKKRQKIDEALEELRAARYCTAKPFLNRNCNQSNRNAY